MATKKNAIGLANDAASLIIKQIGDRYFTSPPAGSFTVLDVMKQYPLVCKEATRKRLDKIVYAGELRSGIFQRQKYYWKPEKL